MNFEKNKAIQTTGIYFILIAVFFYFVWLSEIIPSIRIGETPKSLIETGLPTNGVHVLDLAIVLPGIFLAGILSLRGKRAGLILIPVFLTFFVLMDITIGALVLVMNKKGLESNLSLTAVMGTLAAFSVVLLIWNFKRARYRQGCK